MVEVFLVACHADVIMEDVNPNEVNEQLQVGGGERLIQRRLSVRKIVVVLVVLLILADVGLVVFYLQKRKRVSLEVPDAAKVEVTPAPTLVPTKISVDLNVLPDLQINKWTSKPLSDETDVNHILVIGGEDSIFEQVDMSGELWVNPQMDDGVYFITMYEKILADDGWDIRVKTADYTFEAMIADGVNGGVRGMVKTDGENVRMIQWMYGGGIDEELFVSDIMPMDELVTQAEAN